MPTIYLRWDDNNYVEQGYHIYRSRVVIDVNNPPEPIATVPRKAVRYVDDDRQLISGVTYYYCVGAYIDELIMFSDVIEFIPSDNMVYAITTDNKLVQFHEGNVVWVEDIGEPLHDIYISDENYIYVSTTNNKVHVYDAFSRALTRTLAFSQRILNIVTTLDNSTILFNGMDGMVFINDLPSYHAINNISHSTGSSWYRFIDISPLSWYVTDSRNIYQHDLDGNLNWTHNVPDTIRAISVVNDGVVYGVGSTVVKLNASGNELWRYSLPTTINNISRDAYGNVTVGAGLIAYRLDRSGNLEWSTPFSHTIQDIGKDISGAPYVVSNNNINILSSEGDIRTIITDESILGVTLSMRGTQPDTIVPEASATAILGTDVVGVEENTTIANLGVVGLEYSISHDPIVDSAQHDHGSEYEILNFQYSVAHDPVVTGTIGE